MLFESVLDEDEIVGECDWGHGGDLGPYRVAFLRHEVDQLLGVGRSVVPSDRDRLHELHGEGLHGRGKKELERFFLILFFFQKKR